MDSNQRPHPQWESAGVSTGGWCGARPVWSDVAQARREGLCRECYSDIHGGYAGPVVTRRPIGDLARKRDDEIRALDRWLEAETAARLLGRSVRAVQRWGKDGRLRSNGMWPRVYYYKPDVLTEFGFSPLYAGALSGQ